MTSDSTTESAPIVVAVTGSTGRMGQAVIEAAVDRANIESVVAISHSLTLDEVAGVSLRSADDLETTLSETDTDVLIDFTKPESSVEYAQTAATAGVPIVIGTTGFSDSQLGVLQDVGESIPVLKAANFAPGVQALFEAVENLVRRLPEYDIEVTETHHNAKVDAPSGTAKTLLDRITNVRPKSEYVYGRQGDVPRQKDEIGVYSRRAGDINGENEVLLAANHEVVTIKQRAEDRGVYAAGALDAAVSLVGKPAGWYDFADMVGE